MIFQCWKKQKEACSGVGLGTMIEAQFGQIKNILKNTTFWIHKLSIENKYGVEGKKKSLQA